MYMHHHFGVYARIVRDDKLLVIKKARGPYLGLYDLPGGSMEERELLEETLIREVKEETGLDVLTHTQLGAVSVRYNYRKDNEDAQLRHVGVLYDVTVTGAMLEGGDGEDSAGCIWLERDALISDNATPFTLMAKQKKV